MPEGKIEEGRFGKREFEIDLDAGTVTCPAGHTVAISTSKTGSAEPTSPARCADDCPLKPRCCPGTPTAPDPNCHEHEELL